MAILRSTVVEFGVQDIAVIAPGNGLGFEFDLRPAFLSLRCYTRENCAEVYIAL